MMLRTPALTEYIRDLHLDPQAPYPSQVREQERVEQAVIHDVLQKRGNVITFQRRVDGVNK